MSTSKSVGSADMATGETHDSGEPAATIDAAIQGSLGRKLRESYEEVVKEAVPDRFLQLLNQLKKSEDTGKTGEG